MALHRDIHWIGRQWAVTGFGMQLIDQRHGGKFDIEIARLWDERIPDALSVQKWFNPADFAKGLVIARERHPKPPQPARVAPPLELAAVEPPQPKTLAFHLRVAGSAKFVRSWRIRVKR